MVGERRFFIIIIGIIGLLYSWGSCGPLRQVQLCLSHGGQASGWGGGQSGLGFCPPFLAVSLQRGRSETPCARHQDAGTISCQLQQLQSFTWLSSCWVVAIFCPFSDFCLCFPHIWLSSPWGPSSSGLMWILVWVKRCSRLCINACCIIIVLVTSHL